MKLQQEEEDRNVRATTIKCQLCSQPTEVDALYILDECGHKLVEQYQYFVALQFFLIFFFPPSCSRFREPCLGFVVIVLLHM
jgi:hypothetical protein